jgi:hypothetical protein
MSWSGSEPWCRIWTASNLVGLPYCFLMCPIQSFENPYGHRGSDYYDIRRIPTYHLANVFFILVFSSGDPIIMKSVGNHLANVFFILVFSSGDPIIMKSVGNHLANVFFILVYLQGIRLL